MRIRKFRKEDARICSNIIKQNFLKINARDYPKRTINALIKDSSPKRLIEKSKERQFYIAHEKGKILGIGGYSKEKAHTFFVRTNLHGKGIGKKLLEKVCKEAKKQGIKALHCASSVYAEKFYQAYGFKRVKRLTVPYMGAKLTIIDMKKRL